MTTPPQPVTAKLYLQKGREQAVERRHPWIFSGAVSRQDGDPQDGDLVDVFSRSMEFMARGHYHHGSILVRVLSFEEEAIDADFWVRRLADAYRLRRQLDLQKTNCYRLIHGEGDGLPGLIVDLYNGVAVVQAHTIGMHRSLSAISEALQKVLGEGLTAVYDKSRDTLPGKYASGFGNGYLWGEAKTPHTVQENDKLFLVDWEKGQKTGFYLDQRDNRALLAHYAKGKTVLNAFSYSGGFSVYALDNGARSVLSLDASGRAVALSQENAALNGCADRHETAQQDAMPWFKADDRQFDLVVLDPPAFAKSAAARHRAVQGYKRLNIEGIHKVKPGGLLFTFSCSQVVSAELFYNTVVAACMEVGRQARVIHQMTQGPDHPVSAFHPEGNYLKGLVLKLD